MEEHRGVCRGRGDIGICPLRDLKYVLKTQSGTSTACFVKLHVLLKLNSFFKTTAFVMLLSVVWQDGTNVSEESPASVSTLNMATVGSTETVVRVYHVVGVYIK